MRSLFVLEWAVASTNIIHQGDDLSQSGSEADFGDHHDIYTAKENAELDRLYTSMLESSGQVDESDASRGPSTIGVAKNPFNLLVLSFAGGYFKSIPDPAPYSPSSTSRSPILYKSDARLEYISTLSSDPNDPGRSASKDEAFSWCSTPVHVKLINRTPWPACCSR